MLLERLEISLEHLEMVSDHLCVLRVVDHVDVAVVGSVGVALVLGATHLDDLINGVTRSVHRRLLQWITHSHVLLVLAPIELNKCATVPAIEAGMISGAEFVEFIDYIVKLVSECVEDDSELSLLFLHVHEKTEERWDQMILSSIE